MSDGVVTEQTAHRKRSLLAFTSQFDIAADTAADSAAAAAAPGGGGTDDAVGEVLSSVRVLLSSVCCCLLTSLSRSVQASSYSFVRCFDCK